MAVALVEYASAYALSLPPDHGRLKFSTVQQSVQLLRWRALYLVEDAFHNHTTTFRNIIIARGKPSCLVRILTALFLSCTGFGFLFILLGLLLPFGVLAFFC